MWRVILVFTACMLTDAGLMAQESAPLVPPAFTLHESASKAIAAEWLTDAERSVMRVFHGVWDQRDLISPELRAMVALNAWSLHDPIFDDAQVSAELRAEARLLAGNLQDAIKLLKDARSNRAARIRAEAHELLGDTNQANAAVADPVQRLQRARATEAEDLTQGVRAMMVRARIQGQPARDFQTMMDLLGRARQELDRLHWPTRLVEAELLLEKDNLQEAVQALHETLSLNPRCAQAWYMLGRVALDRFDFTGANTAVSALRRINRTHPLADLLLAESRLVQDDPDQAMDVLQALIKRFPMMRPALALQAAAAAISYDEAAMQAALARYEELSPNSANAYYVAGRHLSFNRQYDLAATALEEAIRRQPAWPAPQIELGLMELQSGRDDRALDILARVIELDPFNTRAANSHFLLEELTKYREIESEHFIVRYQPGEDQVLAEMMLPELERIHSIVSGRFEFAPPQKTLIELHPNHQRFAVRITGMPFVHTIAACTGPVIALEAPREGPPSKHLGLFDWPRVIQHEYTHTITLAQTRNRIPHWLTEAAAVSMEPGPRSYDTYQMLAHAWRQNRLFSLDEIKWAFIRPKQPGDRALAYAQGHWMVEFMNERFGESALVRLMSHYHRGEREQQAIPGALGISREQFFSDFLEWAGHQVKAWGLGAEPSLEALKDQLRARHPDMALMMEASRQARLTAIVTMLTNQIGEPAPGGSSERRDRQLTADQWPQTIRPPVEVDDQTLATWLSEHPNHPDLVELDVRRRLANLGERFSERDDAIIALLERYATLRPVDPYPHKKLAQVWLASATPDKAIPHLEFLDVREEKSPVYAVQLAKLYRQQHASGSSREGHQAGADAPNDLDRALAKAIRALHIHPYSAPNRELAAAIAMELKDYQAARQHIIALTILEPDRPQHTRRLEALDKLMQ